MLILLSVLCIFCYGFEFGIAVSERTHHCSHCGTVLDRDHYAALNILAIGLKNTVGHTEISTPVESLTSAS